MSVQNFVRVPALLLPTNQSVMAMHVTVNPVAYVTARPPVPNTTNTKAKSSVKLPMTPPVPTTTTTATTTPTRSLAQPRQTSLPTNTTTITVALNSIGVTQTTQQPPTQTEVPPAADTSVPASTEPLVRVKTEKIDSPTASFATPVSTVPPTQVDNMVLLARTLVDRELAIDSKTAADVSSAADGRLTNIKASKTYSKVAQQDAKANDEQQEEDDEVQIVKVIDSPKKTDDLLREALIEADKLMDKGQSVEEALDVSLEPLRSHVVKFCRQVIRENNKSKLSTDTTNIEPIAGSSKRTDLGSYTSTLSTQVPVQSDRPKQDVTIDKKLEGNSEDKRADGANDDEPPLPELIKNAVKSTSIKTDGIYFDQRKRKFAYSQRLKTILEESPQIVRPRQFPPEVPLKHRTFRPSIEDRNKPGLPDIVKSHRMKSLVTWPLPAKSFEITDESIDGRPAKNVAKRKISLHYGTVYVDEIYKLAPKKRCEETKEYFDFFAQCRVCDPPTKYLRVEDYLRHHKAKHHCESHLFKMRQESNKTFCASL